MACIMNLGNQTDIKWIYNVSYPVGRGCPNYRDDVLLVQSFLNMLLPCLTILDPSTRKQIHSYLKLDGLFGPRTQGVIMGYQQNVKTRGGVIAADGRVDPAPESGWSQRLNVQYTTVWLNRDYRKNNGGKMATVSQFVPMLRAALLANDMT
jgi:hypothetical protein